LIGAVALYALTCGGGDFSFADKGISNGNNKK
jgi:hypothetical protein